MCVCLYIALLTHTWRTIALWGLSAKPQATSPTPPPRKPLPHTFTRPSLTQHATTR